MFDPAQVRAIFHGQAAQTVLPKAAELERILNVMFYDVETATRAMVLAVLTGESMLFIGPPGVAKSKLISSLCEITGIKRVFDDIDYSRADERLDGGYFEYLLTPFTEPTELFGSLRIEDFNKAVERLGRHETGMIHRSRVVFLDEVFNGSSAILNALLALMNERRFHDRGLVKRAMLQTLFAASNQPPTQPELRAAYDRFTFRTAMDTIEPKPVRLDDLLLRAWTIPEQVPVSGTVSDLFECADDLRRDVRNRRAQLFASGPIAVRSEVLQRLSFVLGIARQVNNQRMSNRRIVKLSEAMLYHRLLRGHIEGDIGDAQIGDAEFELTWKYFLDTPKISAEQDEQFRRRVLGGGTGG